MKRTTIQTSKTARYFTLGELSESTKTIWVVCHGYGQLANYFLRNFNVLENEETVIIAPEGFHRYYLNGFSGRVGASWMTKEDRLNDIKDYIAFLDKIIEEATSGLSQQITINCLGFSQGGATATRWVCQGKTKVNNLVLWAAIYPPDLNFEVDKEILNKCNFKLVIGDQDEFISEEQIQKDSLFLNKSGINHELIRHKGGHKIYSEVLESFKSSLPE